MAAPSPPSADPSCRTDAAAPLVRAPFWTLALAWCLLCSPMLWISTNVRGAVDSLGSALLLSPLLLWAPLGRAAAALMLPVGLAYLAYFRAIGSLPDEYFWFTVLGTHGQEAWEYLHAQRGGDALWVLGWFVPACIASGWLWRHLPRPRRVPHPRPASRPDWARRGRRALRAISLLIVGLWLLVAVVAVWRGHDLRKVLHQMDRVYPLVLLESLLRQQAFAHSVHAGALAAPAFTVQPTARPRADVMVLVIGESATAQRWSLLGYQGHDTNAPLRPYLQQGQLHSLSALANGNNTAMTVPVLMSGHRLEDFPPEGISTYLDWARAAGFRTWSLSNQGHSQGGMETFYQTAFRRRSDSFLSLGLRAQHDGALTGPLLTALESLRDPDSSGQPLLVTLHTYGSHHTASRRYPGSHALWPDAPYDNSIAYSSHLLAQWIGLLQQHVPAPQRAVLMYISDHGVGLPDCGVNFHHSTGRSAFEVPLLFWGNTAFWNDQPAWQARLAQRAQSSPGPDGWPTVDNRIFAATVADLLGYAPGAVLSYPSLGAGDAPPVPMLDGQPYAQRARANACHVRAAPATGSADASSTAPHLSPPAHD